MTGSGESWLSDGLDMPGADSGLWVSGVDYIAGWRESREAADRLNRSFLSAGFDLSAVRAVASTNEEGRGVVRLTGWPAAVDRLARLLESHADGDGDAA
ncbi:hypothetical protein ACFQ6E_20280 [Streptomyces sp. NPDC056462]|uniref:hypothetical protein n=1 Tax=Streptomyces sp. NPDC056462 TaxID=3345826 RepID=UPI0036B90238